ncbi:hypothetical protein KAI54_02895, partial [Candidatus Gracilibacteria bacterium]|nr:hypothetical protein [Candidatus Gracilibacteria bacterium]
MFKNFQHRAQNFINRIVNDPTEASRAVFAGILIIGIFSLSLDLAPRIAPEFFEARLLDPLDRETYKTARVLDGKNNQLPEKLALIKTCAAARKTNNYETFLDNFENSFAGILPGAGNLLLEHPSTVNDRRDKLIFEVMKNYAELKFCIPSDQFKVIYLADYRNVFGKLNFYFQVHLYEKDSKKNLQEIDSVFINAAAKEYILVEKDLLGTQKYVTETIDRAIESAIELDRWTEQRLNNLTAKTNNKLTLGSNELIKKGNDIANENVKVNSANSFLLEQINKVLASIQPYPVSAGGAGVPINRSVGVKYEGEIIESEVHVPNSNGIEKTKSEASSRVTFGLLNLIDKTARGDFLSSRFGKDLTLYVAALNHIDPFMPGSSINPTAISQTAIACHLCSSIDIGKTACYSNGSISSSAIANSTKTTNASDSARASGVTSKPG